MLERGQQALRVEGAVVGRVLLSAIFRQCTKLDRTSGPSGSAQMRQRQEAEDRKQPCRYSTDVALISQAIGRQHAHPLSPLVAA
jgi:hypothetical protein